MTCNSCHRATNFDAARVPGHPDWHLAPLSMAWLGRSLGEICTQLKDGERNGGKTLDEIAHHMAEDSLVGWAWAPGAGRAAGAGYATAAGCPDPRLDRHGRRMSQDERALSRRACAPSATGEI